MPLASMFAPILTTHSKVIIRSSHDLQSEVPSHVLKQSFNQIANQIAAAVFTLELKRTCCCVVAVAVAVAVVVTFVIVVTLLLVRLGVSARYVQTQSAVSMPAVL